MKRFLSIDFDYFVDADTETRMMYFPDGGAESMSNGVKDFVWASRYASSDGKLGEINVKRKDYSLLRRICSTYVGKCMIAESHKHMYDFVLEHTNPGEYFEVYNIDYHHDLYGTEYDVDLTCGNWVKMLYRVRPNMTYIWVGQSDSDCEVSRNSDTEEYPMHSIDQLYEVEPIISNFFDYVFMCRSDMWSPPHLDPKFTAVAKLLSKTNETKLQQGILKSRPFTREGHNDEL